MNEEEKAEAKREAWEIFLKELEAERERLEASIRASQEARERREQEERERREQEERERREAEEKSCKN
jgi:hypothetical protein